MKPTLEEVQDYFKDAETVTCISNGNYISLLDLVVVNELHADCTGYWIDYQYKGKRNNLFLWCEHEGYATIVKTKKQYYDNRRN